MKGRMQDSMALCRKFGKPEFFITFTCNPKWPEITANLQFGQTANQQPDLIVRASNLYLRELFYISLQKKPFWDRLLRTLTP